MVVGSSGIARRAATIIIIGIPCLRIVGGENCFPGGWLHPFHVEKQSEHTYAVRIHDH